VAPAAAVNQEGIAARHVDEQQWGSAKHGDAGLEEGGERFSLCNTLLCGQTRNNYYTLLAHDKLMPSAQLHGNGGIFY
jgi:hypothetical protein